MLSENYKEDVSHQEDVFISKTQKEKALAITQNTKKLTKLSVKEINQLEYSQEIKEELLKTLKIKSFAAKNRHIKYVSGLIRNLEK